MPRLPPSCVIRQVSELKLRYDNGLTKIFETAEQVDGMQNYLEDLQPKLKQATVDTDALLEKIAIDTKSANEVKAVVAEEKLVCDVQAAEAGELAASCQADLDLAMPALEGAIAALKSLSKNDIVEIKAMKKPPDAVKLVMEAVCIMMNVKADKIKDPNGGSRKIDDYWGPSLRVILADPSFLKKLMDYDRDNMAPAMVERVTEYTKMDVFEPEVVKKGSIAAAGLCKWVHAMIVYDKIAKNVAPKKAALKEAEETLATAKAALEDKEAALKEVMDKLVGLNNQLAAAEKKKSDLQKQVSDCATKLRRAEQLLNGLGGEKMRWTELSKVLSTRCAALCAQHSQGEVHRRCGRSAPSPDNVHERVSCVFRQVRQPHWRCPSQQWSHRISRRVHPLVSRRRPLGVVDSSPYEEHSAHGWVFGPNDAWR